MTIKEQINHEISEAFDFVRFLIKNPEEISQIKNNSEINILCKDVPQKSSKQVSVRKSHFPQTLYISEHTFHRIEA